MHILVSGAREWVCTETIITTFNQIPQASSGKPHILMHGACAGLDLLAAADAEKRGWTVLARPADWSTSTGKSAGPIRNRQMLVDHQPDLLVIFHDNLDQSKGTKDMLKQAIKMRTQYGFPKEIWHATTSGPLRVCLN